VTNVGVRPTVGAGQARRVETHLLGFAGTIYGEEVRLAFLRRLRGERRFADFAALRAQIATDILFGAAALAEIAFPPAQEAHFETWSNDGDQVIRVDGATDADLFRQAAAALYEFLHQPHGAERTARRITLPGDGALAERLARWLNMLLAMSAEQGELYDQFIVLATAGQVDAFIGGWVVDGLATAIKLNDVRIEQRPNGTVGAVISFSLDGQI